VVTPQTKYINVAHGEIVNLKVGSKEIAWNFDGLARPFDLSKIVPEARWTTRWWSTSRPRCSVTAVSATKSLATRAPEDELSAMPTSKRR